MFPFYTPLKTPENQRFSRVFRGYKMETFARNGLNKNTRPQNSARNFPKKTT